MRRWMLMAKKEFKTAPSWHGQSFSSYLIVWWVKFPTTSSCLSTINHNYGRSKEAEVLRACALVLSHDHIKLFCTGGSDGCLHLWSVDANATQLKYKKVSSFKHRNEASQIYACEPLINTASSERIQFLTGADNELLMWDSTAVSAPLQKWSFLTHDESSGSVFGGLERNPDREAFIFDAKPCPSSSHYNVVALALSDGTIRLLDIRQAASTATVLHLSSGNDSSIHATSVEDCLVSHMDSNDSNLNW